MKNNEDKSKRNKRVLLHGYTSVNLGDDLFFRIIAERYPDVDFYICSTHNYSAIIRRQNLHWIKWSFVDRVGQRLWKNRYTPIAILSKRWDAIVCIGGSIFIEVGESGSCGTVEHLLQYKKHFPHTPIHIVGSNFGPARTTTFQQRVAELFRVVDTVCLRDSYSYRFFNDNPHVSYAADIVFKLGYTAMQRQEELVGISLIDLDNRPALKHFQIRYETCLRRLITQMLRQGCRVRLFSFCRSEQDLIAIEHLRSHFDVQEQQRIEVVAYEGDIDAMLVALSEVGVLYATRYHAAILGLLMRIPVVPILYSDKMKYALADIGYPGEVADIRLLDDTSDLSAVEPVVLGREKIAQLVASAQTQFYHIDKLLA